MVAVPVLKPIFKYCMTFGCALVLAVSPSYIGTGTINASGMTAALTELALLLAGAFACVGQLGITKAYVCAPAKEISVYDYTQVLFAAALGFFVFGDVPDWLSVLGYVLICGAGVGMFLYNRRHDAAHP